ncbi:MAG: thioredoxin family protein [Anaerolineae bacterium]|nr:thioredoxin family protein [Anaerolineae bacterium]
MKKRLWITLLLAALSLWPAACQGAGPSEGNPTLMFFWAEGCPFCEQVMPIVNEIEDDYGRRLDVIYVSQDEEQGRETAHEYGIVGTPTILLLDRSGEPFQVLRGTLPAAVVEQAVQDLLAMEAQN